MGFRDGCLFACSRDGLGALPFPEFNTISHKYITPDEANDVRIELCNPVSEWAMIMLDDLRILEGRSYAPGCKITDFSDCNHNFLGELHV
ncbi:MAG: hypothetical protein WAqPseu_28510 [Shewanella algae]